MEDFYIFTSAWMKNHKMCILNWLFAICSAYLTRVNGSTIQFLLRELLFRINLKYYTPYGKFFFQVLWGINVKSKKKKKKRKNNRLTGRQKFLSRPDFPFRSSLDLPTSLAQIFSRARSARGRFFMFSAAKASERARAGANYRNRKWEAKNFEKV